MTIARDDDVLGGETRIDGTRVGVRHVAAMVIESGQSPAYTADQFNISMAGMYEALSYYYAHIDVMREIERENDVAFEQVRDSSLKPKEIIQ